MEPGLPRWAKSLTFISRTQFRFPNLKLHIGSSFWWLWCSKGWGVFSDPSSKHVSSRSRQWNPTSMRIMRVTIQMISKPYLCCNFIFKRVCILLKLIFLDITVFFCASFCQKIMEKIYWFKPKQAPGLPRFSRVCNLNFMWPGSRSSHRIDRNRSHVEPSGRGACL